MFRWLTGNTAVRRTGRQLYERIVAQSREPQLYLKCGVPDTMDGRLEMILLHVVLVLDRLKAEGPRGQRVGQALMETLVADMDDALRQIGLGDDSVAHRMPRLAGAIAERSRDYGAAFGAMGGTGGGGVTGSDAAAGDDWAALAAPGPLEAALLEHVFVARDAAADADVVADAMRLGGYVRAARTRLAQLDLATLVRDDRAGDHMWPPVVMPATEGDGTGFNPTEVRA